MTEYPLPTSVTNVKAFLGFTCYYRNYLKGYSHIIAPLFKLMKKDIVILWTPQCQGAFDILKDVLIKAHV